MVPEVVHAFGSAEGVDFGGEGGGRSGKIDDRVERFLRTSRSQRSVVRRGKDMGKGMNDPEEDGE